MISFYSTFISLNLFSFYLHIVLTDGVAVNGDGAVTPRPGAVIAARTIMGLVGTSKFHNA